MFGPDSTSVSVDTQSPILLFDGYWSTSAGEVEDYDYHEANESFVDEFRNPVRLLSANYLAHTTDLIPYFID